MDPHMSDAFIPVADPGAQYRAYREPIDAALKRVAEKGWYVLGEEVSSFEKEFASWVGVPFCTGVANGTDALFLALRAVGVGPGDEVITVSHSAVATAAAIEMCGAQPVFADIHPQTRCMNPVSAKELVSGKTKAIVPVHIFGHPADMAALCSLAAEKGLKVVEDCAQAHGASIGQAKVGTFGDAAAFSFYPTKNLGALGDGGAVVTRHSVVHDRLRALRQYGWKERYVSESVGVNSRLDEIQAAVLRVKLPHLLKDNAARRAVAARYSEALQGGEIQSPVISESCIHAMHLYVVETGNRTALEAYLKQEGIATARHYPLAIHQQPAYKNRCRGSDKLPCTERLYERMLTLPLFPELSAGQVDSVCRALKAWVKR